MNTRSLLSRNYVPAQADSRSSFSNGNGAEDLKHNLIIHLRHCRHRTVCGKDFLYFDGVASSTKISETTCSSCRRAHERRVALRRKARAWEKQNSPYPVNLIKRPAGLKSDGLVQLELAFQKAVAAVEAAELQKS